MSKDITASGPSRRSIAKGAAWAVPAVSVAAAAPALAASTTLPVCPAGTLVVTVQNCNLLGIVQPQTYFRITNPVDSGCTVPAGVQLTLTTSGVAGVSVDVIDGLNADADLIFSGSDDPTTARPLAPGEFIDFQVIPGDINISALARWTLNAGGNQASFTQTANVGLGGTSVASICAQV